MKRRITPEEALAIVNQVRALLFRDVSIHGGATADLLNPDKEWDGDTIEFVAAVFHDAGLVPALEEPYDEVGLR